MSDPNEPAPPNRTHLDRIHIVDLEVPGILGIKPDERINEQTLRINVTMWADTRPAAVSDDIADAVNYRTVAKAIIAHIREGDPERQVNFVSYRPVTEGYFDALGVPLVAGRWLEAGDFADGTPTVLEKRGALRQAASVGITIDTSRVD